MKRCCTHIARLLLVIFMAALHGFIPSCLAADPASYPLPNDWEFNPLERDDVNGDRNIPGKIGGYLVLNLKCSATQYSNTRVPVLYDYQGSRYFILSEGLGSLGWLYADTPVKQQLTSVQIGVLDDLDSYAYNVVGNSLVGYRRTLDDQEKYKYEEDTKSGAAICTVSLSGEVPSFSWAVLDLPDNPDASKEGYAMRMSADGSRILGNYTYQLPSNKSESHSLSTPGVKAAKNKTDSGTATKHLCWIRSVTDGSYKPETISFGGANDADLANNAVSFFYSSSFRRSECDRGESNQVWLYQESGNNSRYYYFIQ